MELAAQCLQSSYSTLKIVLPSSSAVGAKHACPDLFRLDYSFQPPLCHAALLEHV